GVDLPGEAPGVYPTDLDWYRRRWGWAATPTEVLFLSIGQGPNDQTVLKMAQFFAALAGDGRIPAPQLAANAPAGEADVGGLDLRVSAETLHWLREGLRRTVAPGGT